MAYAHHPLLFSHDWFQLHPQWLARLKKCGPAFGLATLLATAALFIWMIYAASNILLQGDEAVAALADELLVHTGISGYIPPRFQLQEIQANTR